jgi:hypothetical protein
MVRSLSLDINTALKLRRFSRNMYFRKILPSAFFMVIFLCSAGVSQVRVYPEMKKIIARSGEKISGNFWVIAPDNREVTVSIMPEDWTKGRKKDVDSGKRKEVKWKAVVPHDAKGDLIAQIFVASRYKERFTGLLVGARVAYSLYITVMGTEQPEGWISHLDVERADNGYHMDVLFENTGNVSITTKGTVELEHLESGDKYEIEFKPWFYRPGEIFKMRAVHSGVLSSGKYIARVFISYTEPIGHEHSTSYTGNFTINDEGEVSNY